MENITKKAVENGVEVTIVIKGDRFDIIVDIPPETFIAQKLQGKLFNIKIKLKNGHKKTEEPIHFMIKNRSYNNLSITQNYKVRFTSKDFNGEISIFPELYLLDELLLELNERKKKSQPKRKKKGKKRKSSLGGIRRPGIAVSRSIPYSKNNVSRPYQGGACSPK